MKNEEKIGIAHEVIIKKASHKEVAFEYQVKTRVVDGIIQKVRKNPKHLQELMEAEEKKELRVEQIKGAALRIVEAGEQIHDAK